MKADLSKMRRVRAETLRANETLRHDLYLHLPKNGRMVRLAFAGDSLSMEKAGMLAQLAELYSPEYSSVAALRDASHQPESLAELAARLRDQVARSLGDFPASGIFREVLDFRASQPADSHSVLVGSVSAAIALEDAPRDPMWIAELLLAATFHDAALPAAATDHEQASADLVRECSIAAPARALAAIERHHSADSIDSSSLLTYLARAEAFAGSIGEGGA